MSAAPARGAPAALSVPRPPRPLLEVPKMVVVWAVMSLLVSVALFLTAPALFGYRTMAVLSGSMEPNLNVGGVVVSKRIPPLDARLGDIVTFKDPGRGSKLVSHRLTGMKVRGETVFMTTKGDANDAAESWAIPKTGEIGRVEFHVPKLGYFQRWLNGRGVHIALVVLLVGLGIFMIVDIWRPKPAPAADADAEGGTEGEEEAAHVEAPAPAAPAPVTVLPVEEVTAVLTSVADPVPAQVSEAPAPEARIAPAPRVAPAPRPSAPEPAPRRIAPGTAVAIAGAAASAVLLAARRRSRR